MKEELRGIVEAAPSVQAAWNRSREYLQAMILGIMQETGAMISLAFCGGTALRFLYSLPRFSEDLDFSLERNNSGFDLDSCIGRVRKSLERKGYDIQLKSRKISAVSSTMIRFPGLPFEMGLSPRRTQVLSIKVDVDTNPPEGAGLDISIVRRFLVLRLQHYDKSSLLSGKLHAVLVRGYLKGRDYYDLMWYMTDPDWPPPNMLLLRNALLQTGWTKKRVLSLDIGTELKNRYHSLDWTTVRRDILPFLERPAEAEVLNEQDMISILENFLDRC